jgi:TonB family protein
MLRGLTLAMMAGFALQELKPTPEAEAGRSVPTEAAARCTEGQQIKEPKKKKHVAPVWPENAARAGLNGTVVLECEVDIRGDVTAVRVLEGYRSLAAAASRAARQWRYTPVELDGKPVAFIMTVTVRFELQPPPTRRGLMESTRDRDPEIRWAAVRWLGRYRPVTAAQVEVLQAALQDTDERVRAAAETALKRLESHAE